MYVFGYVLLKFDHVRYFTCCRYFYYYYFLFWVGKACKELSLLFVVFLFLMNHLSKYSSGLLQLDLAFEIILVEGERMLKITRIMIIYSVKLKSLCR